MDFFQAQDDARERTRRLLVYYAIAVVVILTAVYFAVTVGFFVFEHLDQDPQGYRTRVFTSQRLAVTLGCTLGLILFAALYKHAQLRAGGPAVCASLGARPVDMGTRDRFDRKLIDTVQEMSIASGVPMPMVYVLEGEPAINAFAAGLTLNDAAVVVTRGALLELDRDELQAVVAHEFSHILNGDMRLNLRLVSLLHGILVLTIFARAVRRVFFSRESDSSEGASELPSVRIRWKLRLKSSDDDAKIRWKVGGYPAIAVAVVVVIALVTLIGFIGSFFARLIQSGVSRNREFLADASAVQFTRNPVAVANALRRVGGHDSVVEAAGAAALAHCFFANTAYDFLAGRFRTHPPLEQRILAVDAKWDGRMLARREPEPTAQAVAAQAALGAFVGLLRAPELGYARDLLAQIPGEIREALMASVGAEALVYVLLLHPDPERRARQWHALEGDVDPEVLEAMRGLSANMQQLTPAWRLPLLELSIPALRAAPGRVLRRLDAHIDAMILVDERVDLFEFVLRRIVHDRLLPSMTAQAYDPLAGRPPPPEEIRGAAASVLSAVVSSAVHDPDQAAGVVTELSAAAGYTPPLAYAGRTEFTRTSFALDVLRSATFADRRRLLSACERGILHDGQVSIEEGELFRAIAGAIGVPVAPRAGVGDRSGGS
ncbi:MAG: M48 family metalloprotease [Polyangiaceae bacterium]|nr:M48 family metalloprotease [Polyangiaceae bacterium]